MSSVPADAPRPVEGSRGTIYAVVVTLSMIIIVSKVAAYRRNLKAVSSLPGFRVPFHPNSLLGVFIPTTWWNPSFYFVWKWRDYTYKHYGNDTVSYVPFLLGPAAFYTANLDVLRQVASSSGGRSFYKSPGSSGALLQWGLSLVTADGDVWRKHRRIMGPAFNNKLYEAVWRETVKMYHEMVADEGWTTKERIDVSAVQSLTFKLALLIIGKCGFGFPFNWSDPARTPDGKMSLQEALRIVTEKFLITTFVPKWIQMLPLKVFQEGHEAKAKLMEFMQEQVTERKADVNTGGAVHASDAFSMLVEASEHEEAKYRMDDSELIGNVFIMLFAGHETTAHSLSATLGFLSVYADLQEEIYQQIISVVGYERDPVYDDYPKLNKVLAAFFEGLRLFPSGYLMIREAFEDTMLQVPNPHGEDGIQTLHVPKGTEVIVDMIGVHYNPRYFESPKEFKPSRWYEVSSDSEAFTAFSIGPRTCIGRKFATTEAVCFLTMLLRDYKVEPLLKGKETPEQWKTRVLDGRLGLTLGVKEVPITFARRRAL